MTASSVEKQAHTSHRLVQAGILLFLLFLLELLTGFAGALFFNPRIGLSSHLEGIMNDLFLVAAGLVWPRLALPTSALRIAFWLALYGTFANWTATLLAAVWGAGGGRKSDSGTTG